MTPFTVPAIAGVVKHAIVPPGNGGGETMAFEDLKVSRPYVIVTGTRR